MSLLYEALSHQDTTMQAHTRTFRKKSMMQKSDTTHHLFYSRSNQEAYTEQKFKQEP